jgi:hypothetical protein
MKSFCMTGAKKANVCEKRPENCASKWLLAADHTQPRRMSAGECGLEMGSAGADEFRPNFDPDLDFG